jgi:hypothetical protein
LALSGQVLRVAQTQTRFQKNVCVCLRRGLAQPKTDHLALAVRGKVFTVGVAGIILFYLFRDVALKAA